MADWFDRQVPKVQGTEQRRPVLPPLRNLVVAKSTANMALRRLHRGRQEMSSRTCPCIALLPERIIEVVMQSRTQSKMTSSRCQDIACHASSLEVRESTFAKSELNDRSSLSCSSVPWKAVDGPSSRQHDHVLRPASYTILLAIYSQATYWSRTYNMISKKNLRSTNLFLVM